MFVENSQSKIELYNSPLNVNEIHARWAIEAPKGNFGALTSFIGVVREEDGIEALYFQLFEPVLKKWFEAWRAKIESEEARLFMAHSIGDVKVGESSFMAGILSRKRRFGLEMIDAFVEDFKKNAPIWKYDVKDGKRLYAEERSHKIDGGGLLA